MGQPATGNNKAYCNNIIMYLSRRIHPEIPGGDRGLIEAQMCVICEEICVVSQAYAAIARSFFFANFRL
jgi:hypothetical protein